MLTEGLSRLELQCRELTAMSRGGVGTKQAVRAVQSFSGRLDPLGRPVVLLRSQRRGQRDPRTTGGEQLLGARCLPELGAQRDSGDAEA